MLRHEIVGSYDIFKFFFKDPPHFSTVTFYFYCFSFLPTIQTSFLSHVNSSFFKKIIYYFTLQYCIGFAIVWLVSSMGVHMSPSWTPYHLPPHTIPLDHPRAPALRTLSHASNLDWRFCFTYDNLHVSMPFSHIISPSPSPTESKRLFNTSVSLLLSHIEGYRYHLSKFHIYALVYFIGVFLYGLLHSV